MRKLYLLLICLAAILLIQNEIESKPSSSFLDLQSSNDEYLDYEKSNDLESSKFLIVKSNLTP
jgi:hypothetical protein